MSNYNSIAEAQLVTLQQGLDIIGHVDRTMLPSTLYLYGMLTPDSPALSVMSEGVWEADYMGEKPASDLKITTAGVAIRLSDDILQSLLGAGIECNNSEFCYFINGEPKTATFEKAKHHPTLSIAQLQHTALANGSYWLEDYVKAEGGAAEGVVTRTQDEGRGGLETSTTHTHQSSSNTLIREIAELLSQPKGWKHGDL